MRNIIITDLYKPVRNFGFFFVIIGLSGFWILFKNLKDIEHAIAVWLFLGPLSLFHLVLGIGIILKNRLGFSIFKAYLKLMYIAFPIGTILSKKTLKYIEENNVECFLK